METKHEYLSHEEYYESKSVNKGRSNKTCEHCGVTISIGTPHDMHIFYPEFASYAVHKHCHDDFMLSLNTSKDFERKEYEQSVEYQLELTRKIIKE